jgi:hypothetical protein
MPNPILIAVPPHLVPAVTELLAGDNGPPGRPGLFSAAGPLNGWTEEALRQHYRDSSPKMQAFFRFLAEHADEEVTSHEAAEAIGYPDWNSIAGMLGAAARRAANHYGLQESPWVQRWANDGQARFTMPRDLAAVILDEAGE